MLYAPYLPRWRKLLVPFTLKQPVCQAIQCHFSYHWCSFYVVAEFQKAWNITVNKYTHTYSYAVHRDLSGVFLRLYCVISFTRTTHAKTVFAMFFFSLSLYTCTGTVCICRALLMFLDVAKSIYVICGVSDVWLLECIFLLTCSLQLNSFSRIREPLWISSSVNSSGRPVTTGSSR